MTGLLIRVLPLSELPWNPVVFFCSPMCFKARQRNPKKQNTLLQIHVFFTKGSARLLKNLGKLRIGFLRPLKVDKSI